MISFELKPKTLDLANELLLSAKSVILKHEKAQETKVWNEESTSINFNLEGLHQDILKRKAKV